MKRSLTAVFVLAALTAPGALAQEDRTFTEVVPTGSDADKTVARAKVSKKVIEHILRDWSFSAVKGQQRVRLIRSVRDALRQERFHERRGRWRYRAQVNMSEVRNKVLDALEVRKTFGMKEFLIVAYDKNWYSGGGLSPREVKVLHRNVVASCSDYMNRHRFREASSNRERVAQAAISLGSDATTSQMQGFGMMFGASTIVSIQGAIKFEPFAAGTPQAAQFEGYMRCMGVKARIYDRDTDTILAQFSLRPDKRYRNPRDMTPQRMHCPWVARGGSRSEVAETYAQDIGKMIAVNVMKRMFDRFYAHYHPPKPRVETGPRDCPGCGDRIIDGLIKECPACESPLPAPGRVLQRREHVNKRIVTVYDYYKIEMKGWPDEEAEELIEGLEEQPGFDRFKEKGSHDIYVIWFCTYIGKAPITRHVMDVLEDLGRQSDAKVDKIGNRVIIYRRG